MHNFCIKVEQFYSNCFSYIIQFHHLASKEDLPQVKPQTKPDQVSTELPFVEETTSAEKNISERMPLTTVTIQSSTTSTPVVTTTIMPEITTLPTFRDSLDEDFGIQDDDSDDTLDEELEPTSEESEHDEDKATTTSTIEEFSTTFMQSSTQDNVTPESISEDAPGTLAQVNTSPKAEDEQETTAPSVVEVSSSTTTESKEITDSEPTTSSSIDGTTTTSNPTDCVFLEKTYKDKEQIPSVDPCQLCFCTSGELVCAVKECPVPSGMENCIAREAAEGECCPTEYECGV